jgi:hypothetical protein
MKNNTIKLTIEERINIFTQLPSRGGTKETQRNFRSFKKKIELTDEEEKRFNVRVLNNGAYTWNDHEKKAKEYQLTAEEIKSLKFFFNNLEEQAQFPVWGVDIDDQLETMLPEMELKPV